jgi:hypothetical protein
MSQHEGSQIIGALIVLYLGGLLFVARYLKTKHEEVWKSLGRPSLLNWSILSSFKLGAYVFFSGAYSKLSDTRLTYAIYGLRFLVILTIGTIIWWKLSF